MIGPFGVPENIDRFGRRHVGVQRAKRNANNFCPDDSAFDSIPNSFRRRVLLFELVGRKPTGTLVLHNLPAGKRLLLLSTGTGLAPFASLLKDPQL